MPANKEFAGCTFSLYNHRSVILSEAIHMVNRAVEGPAVRPASHRLIVRRTSLPACPTPRSNQPTQGSAARATGSSSPGTTPSTVSPAQLHPRRKQTAQKRPGDCIDTALNSLQTLLACAASSEFQYCQSLRHKDYGYGSPQYKRSTPDHSLRQHSKWT